MGVGDMASLTADTVESAQLGNEQDQNLLNTASAESGMHY